MTDEQTFAVCGDCLGRLVPADDQHECQILRAHSVLGSDYPALAAVWENDEDEAAPSTEEGEARPVVRETITEAEAKAQARVLRWYGSMPAGDFFDDVQEYRAAIRAPLEEQRDAFREVSLALDREKKALHEKWIHEVELRADAEAEVERLRGALREIATMGGGDVMALRERMARIANGALATPPSSTEGTKEVEG